MYVSIVLLSVFAVMKVSCSQCSNILQLQIMRLSIADEGANEIALLHTDYKSSHKLAQTSTNQARSWQGVGALGTIFKLAQHHLQARLVVCGGAPAGLGKLACIVNECD